MIVRAFVQAVERRRRLVERLTRQLTESDLDGHEVLYQLPEHDPWQHLWRVLEAMRDSDADLVIRLEDDALVGKHLKHNVVTWPVIGRKDFGCGWLYSSPASVLDYIYHARLNNPNRKSVLDGSVGILFWRKDLDWMVPAFQDWARRCPRGYAYDYCISAVMHEQKRTLWSHDPPIVEHDKTVDSTFRHEVTPLCSTVGLARLDWRRAV